MKQINGNISSDEDRSSGRSEFSLKIQARKEGILRELRYKDAAVKAIKSGAREYLPLPPDEELIAAVLEADIGRNSRRRTARQF